jgi:hypothetical protein
MDTKSAQDQIVRKYGLPYNSAYCLPNGEKDYHRVLWSVEDGCGNQTTCEYLFRLEDCKKPTPVCINGLSTVVMPSAGEVTIWAVDFNASSFDDCTPADELDYSFLGSQHAPSAKFACDCDETTPDYAGQPCYGIVQSQTNVFEVEIWVADHGNDLDCNGSISWSEQNKDYCTTYIVVDDNENVCGNSGSAAIGGIIRTEDAETVGSAEVNVQGSDGTTESFMTATDGTYSFELTQGIDYTVRATRTDDPMNGVSTLDLVRIQKHLLGITPFDSPYKLIAADANNSESVSAIDLVELRKLILGIYVELPNNNSWRLVDAGAEVSDPNNPWPADETIEIIGLTENMMDNDFMAVKVGDVNGTVVVNAQSIEERGAKEVLKLYVEDQAVEAGKTYNVTFTSDNFTGILGYQFTLQAEGLTYESIEGGLTEMGEENLGLLKEVITASWHRGRAVEAGVEEGLFTIAFTATESGMLSQMLSLTSTHTVAEAYNAEEEIMDIALTFRSGTVEVSKEFALYQNEPNPFNAETVVGFDLPEAGEATLTVFDVTGKVVTVVEGDYVKGYNEVQLDGRKLSAMGVMYYRLDADAYTATKKMVVIE